MSNALLESQPAINLQGCDVTSRDLRNQQTEKALLEHMEQRFNEHRAEDAWLGQRVSDIAQEMGWPAQKVGPALRRLRRRGTIKATTITRCYGRSRLMDETRYRFTPTPSWPVMLFGLQCQPAGLR